MHARLLLAFLALVLLAQLAAAKHFRHLVYRDNAVFFPHDKSESEKSHDLTPLCYVYNTC